MTTILPPEKKPRTKARPPRGGKTRTQKKTKPSAVKKTGIGSVARSWELFGKQLNAARKGRLAAAAEAGINPNTAKTQYQRWLHRGDKKTA